MASTDGELGLTSGGGKRHTVTLVPCSSSLSYTPTTPTRQQPRYEVMDGLDFLHSIEPTLTNFINSFGDLAISEDNGLCFNEDYIHRIAKIPLPSHTFGQKIGRLGVQSTHK